MLTVGHEILPYLLNSILYHVDNSSSLALILNQLSAVRSLVSHLFHDNFLSYPWDPKVVCSIYSEQYLVGTSQPSIFFFSFINIPRLATSEIQHHKYYNRTRFTASALLSIAGVFNGNFVFRKLVIRRYIGTRNYPDNFEAIRNTYQAVYPTLQYCFNCVFCEAVLKLEHSINFIKHSNVEMSPH